MKTELQNPRRWIVVFVLSLAVTVAKAQTANGLTGNKTGNIVQPANLLGKSTGNAGISTPPMNAQLSATSTLLFYYGDTILNTSASNPATVTASRVLDISGVETGGGDAYIQFRNAGNASLTSGTTSYIKIGQIPTVTGLTAPKGGLLGLAGFYAISGDGYANAANYTLGPSGNEQAGTDLGTARTELLVDKNGVWYAAVTPNGSYNSFRLKVAFAAGANLSGSSRDLAVKAYNAFYYSAPGSTNCGKPIFTTPGAVDGTSSLTLGSTSQLAALDTAVLQPEKAIDDDTSTYSRITRGALGIATSVSQTLLFHGPGNSSDVASIKLSLPASAITNAILSNLSFTAYNGNTQVGTSVSLTAAQLDGVGNHMSFYVDIQPGAVFDRVKITLGDLANISASLFADGLRIYEAVRVTNAPVITAQPVNDTTCENGTALFSANATGNALTYEWQSFQINNWTNAGTTNPLAVTNVTEAMDGRIYRVLVSGGSCPTWPVTYVSEEAELTVRPVATAPPIHIE